MSSNPSRSKPERMRHRIIEIELVPTTSTSNRKISAKVFVDGEVVCELPWVKSGRSLRWTKLIVYDGSNDSKVTLEICEKHSIRDRRFRSDSYVISGVQQQTEVTVGINDFAWNATFKLLTQAAAERAFAAGLDKLRELKSAPNTLERLGRARPVFEAMLQLGSEISEIHPTAKVVFVICTKAWEKLEAQEECDENVRELLDGLGGILGFVELVKKHARTERLQTTIRKFLNLVEDVSIYTAERAELTNGAGRTLRELLESRERIKIKTLLSRFEQLQAELDIGIGVETHKMVNVIDLHGRLSQLQPVTPSGYDPTRACQDGTRLSIISDIMSWTERPEASECLLWVHGQAGIGKSSIATSVCRKLADDKVLAASFFCKRDDPELRDPLRLISSIAHGLAIRHSSYAQAVATAIQEDRELCTAHMDIRYKGLIKKPLQSLEGARTARPLIVLIDALDECGTDDTRRRLLRHLSDMSKLVPWLRLIITSRPNNDIQDFFQNPDNAHVSYCNVQSFDASDDIRAYIEKELGDIAHRHQWDEGSLDKLCEKAGGVFIWATTARNYLTNFRGSTVPRLRSVLHGQKSTVSDHLDMLYRSVILAGMKDTEEDQKELFRQCIGVIVIASTRQPLSIPSLSSLLLGQLDPIALEEVVSSLDAVLHLDEEHQGAVRFYHPSFADYATDPSRSGDLYVVPDDRNTELAAGCLKTMERELRFNICKLETSYLLNSQVLDLAERIDSNIGDQLGYACTYWISHLLDTPKGTLTHEVQEFMNSPQVLYWLEVLSLLDRVEVGLQGLFELQDWLSGGADELLVCVEDMHKFVSAFYDAISSSAPHIYVSALALAPSSALVVRRFGSLFSNTVAVTSGGDADWPRWLRTLVHPDDVLSLAISSDGRFIVTGCLDGAVYIWDIKSGAIVGEPLFADLGFARCVALSSDGRRIVAGYFGRALQLWDTASGVAIGEPLRGHCDVVYCAAFSPDDRLIASGSVDKTIRLWDSETGASAGTLLVKDSLDVNSIAFSSDGKYIISSLSPGTVRIWVTNTLAMVNELNVDKATIHCAAFFPDSSRIIYGSSVGLATVQWDPRKICLVGEPLTLDNSHTVCSLAFSPDGQRVVFASHDNALRIWDLAAGSMTDKPLTGHSDSVKSVAFLPDGWHVASCSDDRTVRLWDTRHRPGIALGEPHTSHSDTVVSVAFSPDSNCIVSGSHDKTVRMWNAKTGAAVGETLAKHSDCVNLVAFSPSGDYIISGSYDNALLIWGRDSGSVISELLVAHSDPVHSVALSPDRTHIASGFPDGTLILTSIASALDENHVSGSDSIVQVWRIQTNDATTEQLTDDRVCIISLVFSPDGNRIASGSWGKIYLWDTKTGMAVGNPLVGRPAGVAVAFSPDGKHLVSGFYDSTLQLWGTAAGVPIGEPLVGHTSTVTCVAFSLDGNLIVSGSYDKTVRLWDSKTGMAIGGPFVGHTNNITCVAFSPDSSFIASGSRDSSVRVWTVKAGAVTGTNSTNSEDPRHCTTTKFGTSWPSHTHGLPALPEHRGWVSLDDKSLLLWLPSHYRREYSPNMLHTISTDLSQSIIQLDFSKFAHGSDWASVACDRVRQNLL